MSAALALLESRELSSVLLGRAAAVLVLSRRRDPMLLAQPLALGDALGRFLEEERCRRRRSSPLG